MNVQAALLLALASPTQDTTALTYPAETFRLENGLLVTLHQDRSLPQVVVDTWYWVGSKDEAPGRTGFAHLFEHLMFMGTERVPDNLFDVLMESGGGWNNASTSEDRTNYFSVGPSGLLETLLWLDADRLEALGLNMTQEKLDKQREVVRNERRQTSENTPYGKSELLIPELMYPVGHPYHHPVIGSHADLEAATLADVVGFFDTYYTTTNASLVVAGDFELEEARRLVERTFGAVPRRPPPRLTSAPPVTLQAEVREVAFDRVQFPKLTLVWHSPAHYQPGDAEMDVLAALLADGPSSRLERKLVHELLIAQEVSAYQASSELGSLFVIEALAAPGADLEEIRRVALGEVERLLADGPAPDELARVVAQIEADFLQSNESLFARADRMNGYVRRFGDPNSFQRDLERWTTASADDVVRWGRRVIVPELLDLRVLPEGAEVPAAWSAPAASAPQALEHPLDARPGAPRKVAFTPPAPVELRLSNGVRVLALPRPGTGLFAGAVYGKGGAGVIPEQQAGLAALAAALLEAGSAGMDAAQTAAAIESLGASISVDAGRYGFSVSVQGLSSRLGATLDLFRDVVLRPNLADLDFAREKGLLASEVAARADDPRQVAGVVARALAFGRAHASGVAVDGYDATVASLSKDDVVAALPALLSAANATLCFAGDFEPEALREELERRFAAWEPASDAGRPQPAPIATAPPGRIVVVDRPGAAQTMIQALRPLPAPKDDAERATRRLVVTALGGSFTSRLNQNLRERNGYTYGAGARVAEEQGQHLFVVSTAVHTPVTGAALAEIRRELDALQRGDVTEAELEKARETVRNDLATALETTQGAAAVLQGTVADLRPPDALARELAALDGVTLAQANALAKSGALAFGSLQIVLVGDKDAILPQLEDAGFPPPLEADAEGELATR